jgi:hypothetical protein
MTCYLFDFDNPSGIPDIRGLMASYLGETNCRKVGKGIEASPNFQNLGASRRKNMTSFTFSADQVRSAPAEVRRWMENEIAKTLSLRAHSEQDTSKMHAGALAACTADEVVQIFDLISGNFFVTHVFFELARETPLAHRIPSLHGLDLSDMQRHVQIEDGRLLVECLNAINQSLQKIRNDHEASLFASDEQGHIYIHETTYRSIRRLREQLIPAPSPSVLPQSDEEEGFTPPGLETREPMVQPERAFGRNPDIKPDSLV